jgi:3-oxoacyl-[acyl-carrier protein] reductase
MDLRINGKVALMSGGSRGIGRGVAEMLAEDGCLVAIAALPDDQFVLDEVVNGIEKNGGRAMGIAADMTNEHEIDRAVSECRANFGDPDIVIANVYGPPPGFFEEVTNEQFEKSVKDMTLSLVYLLRRTIPHMKESGWGRIVNMNSIGAKEPTRFPGHVLVNTGRAAAVALAKSLSDEYAQFGITVNSIGTGFIGTDRMYSYWDRLEAETGTPRDELLRTITDTIPSGRVGHVDEIAATVAFLCSENSGYVNGEFINVDGGWHRSAW